MSDIDINLDGLITLIAATCLSLLLLVGIIVCALLRRAQSAHMKGMLLSLSCSILIILLTFISDRTERPHTLNRWLDAWVWLWVPLVLSVWPLYVYRRGKTLRS
jgi:chromate transport protein ChrA